MMNEEKIERINKKSFWVIWIIGILTWIAGLVGDSNVVWWAGIIILVILLILTFVFEM